MDLLNRYLNAVAARLPREQRADIEAELRETLLSRIEEREAELRRVLTADDVVALLKQYGHPLVVAGRYHHRQHLIGPAFLPFYWFGVQVALGLDLMAHIVAGSLALATGGSVVPVLMHTLRSLGITAIYLFGIMTLSALALERLGLGRWLATAWNPRYLPGKGALRTITGGTLTLDLILTVVLVLCATGAMHSVALLLRWPVGKQIQAAPIWAQMGWLVVLVAVAQFAIHIFGFLRSDSARSYTVANIGLKVAVLAVLSALFRGRPWVEVVGLPAPVAQATSQALHIAIGIGLAVIALFAAIQLARDVLSLLRGMSEPRFIAAIRSNHE